MTQHRDPATDDDPCGCRTAEHGLGADVDQHLRSQQRTQDARQRPHAENQPDTGGTVTLRCDSYRQQYGNCRIRQDIQASRHEKLNDVVLHQQLHSTTPPAALPVRARPSRRPSEQW